MQHAKTITIALITAMLAFSTAAVAQKQGQGQRQAQQQAAPAADIDVSDADLQAFADARGELSSIQQEYSQQMQNADNPEKANELQQQANEEMINAVEEAGLEVDEFNQIAMAIQNDPELQQRLQEIEQ